MRMSVTETASRVTEVGRSVHLTRTARVPMDPGPLTRWVGPGYCRLGCLFWHRKLDGFMVPTLRYVQQANARHCQRGIPLRPELDAVSWYHWHGDSKTLRPQLPMALLRGERPALGK